MKGPTNARSRRFAKDLDEEFDSAAEAFGNITITRIREACYNFGIRKLSDFPNHTRRDFQLLHLFGPKALAALDWILDRHGLSFDGEEPRHPLVVPDNEIDDIRERLLHRLSANAENDRGMLLNPKDVFVLSVMLKDEIRGLAISE